MDVYVWMLWNFSTERANRINAGESMADEMMNDSWKDKLIEDLREALRPFAKMHRRDIDPKICACAMLHSSITYGDFARAHLVLDDHSI
jgi:hypothetical protein